MLWRVSVQRATLLSSDWSQLTTLLSVWLGGLTHAYDTRPPSRSPMGGKISVRSGHSACEGSNGASCCAALTRHPGAGRPGRRSADLNVGAPAGRTFGLIAAGAGSLRRRRLSCLVNLRPRSCSRQGADRVGQPAPIGSFEMRPHVGARAVAAQRCAVRRRVFPTHRGVRWNLHAPTPWHPATRTRSGSPTGHLDPALALPTRPLPLAPHPFALPRAQVGPPLALPERLTAGGGDFQARVGPDVGAKYPCAPPCECKPAPSHPAAPHVTTRARLANAVLRRPAEAEGPRCARAGRRLSGRGPSSCT